MDGLGGGVWRPLPRKRVYRVGIGLKYMFITQFFMVSSKKKIRLVTLLVWVLGRVETHA